MQSEKAIHMEKILIIGGGASGMLAALTAAQDASRKVILLERQQRVGKKLLSTGNGRCNLTNTGAALKNYHGEQSRFAESALTRFPPEKVLEFFASLGLLTQEEYGGRVYPFSNSANSVVDVLRFALEQRGVEVHTSCTVQSLRRTKSGFLAECGEERFTADAVIVACGGMAGGKVGGVKDGYELLKSLGHSCTRLSPSLVQVTCDSDLPRALKGVRCEASLRLCHGRETLDESKGELQFTEKGISGPAVFDLSRTAARAGEHTQVHCRLLPLSVEETLAWLKKRRSGFPQLEAGELLTGMLHNRLGRMLVKRSGIDCAKPCAGLTDSELRALAALCGDLVLPVRGTEGFDNAQVTAGGIRTSEFSAQTLESRLVPGLYACGEVLDIDADCGGYNLQWAWSSGYVAGRLGK